MTERKLEILLTPHFHDNKCKPYFWCILEYNEEIEDWHNSGICGWSESIEEAFKEAKKHF